MAPKKSSNGDSSDFQDALDNVLFASEEAFRLSDAAQACPDDPNAIAKAERTLAEAAEGAAEEAQLEAIDKALEIDPGCTDALVLRATSYSEPTDASILLEVAVEVAERRLGPDIFANKRGEFWDIPETRPYIRALYALSEADFEAMDYEACFNGFGKILELAENDNLGVRFTLLGMLLAADRVEQARRIAFERYAQDDLPFMLWTRTLILLLERDFDGAAAMLDKAREANPYVQEFLTDTLEMPDEEPALYRLGSPEEAAVIVSDLAAAWRIRPLALIWLQTGGDKPGGERYFGGYTDVELDQILDELDDEDWDDEFDDDPDEGGPFLVN